MGRLLHTAMALNPEANQYTGQSMFNGRLVTYTPVNKGRQAGQVFFFGRLWLTCSALNLGNDSSDTTGTIAYEVIFVGPTRSTLVKLLLWR